MGSGRTGRRITIILALAACLLPAWTHPAVCGRIDPDKVALVQAVYLYKFTKLICWPAAAFAAEHDPVVIGILDDEDVAAALEEGIPERPAGDRPTEVRRLSWAALRPEDASRESLRTCHVLFIPASRQEAVRALPDLVGEAAILTVGNSGDFAVRNGMIEFYLDGDRVGIRINVDRLNRRNLKVSSRLLKLATIVEDDGT